MKSRIFFWSITSALAGFLFGFDTIVISGAEQKIQSIWELDSVLHGLCMSAALWGTVLIVVMVLQSIIDRLQEKRRSV